MEIGITKDKNLRYRNLWWWV